MRTEDSNATIDWMHLTGQNGTVTRVGRALGLRWSKAFIGTSNRELTAVHHVMPAMMEAAIIETSLANPAWGAVRVRNALRAREIPATRENIALIWNLYDLKARHQRFYALQKSLESPALPAPPRVKKSRKRRKGRALRVILRCAMGCAVVMGLMVAGAIFCGF